MPSSSHDRCPRCTRCQLAVGAVCALTDRGEDICSLRESRCSLEMSVRSIGGGDKGVGCRKLHLPTCGVAQQIQIWGWVWVHLAPSQRWLLPAAVEISRNQSEVVILCVAVFQPSPRFCLSAAPSDRKTSSISWKQAGTNSSDSHWDSECFIPQNLPCSFHQWGLSGGRCPQSSGFPSSSTLRMRQCWVCRSCSKESSARKTHSWRHWSPGSSFY